MSVIEFMILFLIPVFFFSFIRKVKDLFDKIRSDRSEKQKSLDKLLDKYVTIEKKQYFIEKYTKITEIIAETEEEVEHKVQKKIKELQSKFNIGDHELNLIRQGSIDYNTFMSKLKTAEPVSEEQRKKDLEDLQSAISILESFDEEFYKSIPKRHDLGMGMFLDKMTRRFQKILQDNQLINYDFIPIQQLKYHAFQEIKNIKDKDVLSILKIMKETNIIHDIVEIDPTFQLIVLNETLDWDLSVSDKVIISLLYDEAYLTRENLLKKTEWKKEHADKVIENLAQKSIIRLENDTMRVDSFGSVEERKVWNDLIKVKVQDEKEKEEARKKYLERSKTLLAEKVAQKEALSDTQSQPRGLVEAEPINDEEFEEKTQEKLKEIEAKNKPKPKSLPPKSNEIDEE